MLIKFSFKNFKSFRDENCLDMQATVLKEHEYNVANINGERYLKVAAIYGANASGKTNVLDAFDFMKRVILINDDTKNFEKENTLSFMVNDKPIELEVDTGAITTWASKNVFKDLNIEDGIPGVALVNTYVNNNDEVGYRIGGFLPYY